MTEPLLTHRFRTGHEYKGIAIHAAPGVHDYAAELAQANLPDGARVLDIGSGSGALAARLTDIGYKVLATDIDLRGFSAPCPSAVWDASDERSPPPEAHGTFDAVCAVEILEHTENPLAALRNCKRMLRPGGYLIASTPNVCHPRSRLKFLLRGAPSYFGPGEYKGSGHRSLLPDWMLQLHLDAVGFDITRVAYAGDMEMSPLYRLAFPVFELTARLALRTPRADHGDGACVFFVARPRAGSLSA